MDIGKRIAWARNKAGHTQESLATATGLSRPHIQKMEGNAHSPTIATLSVILKACNISLAEFFESKIPQKYADPRHAELHEKLQEILEDGEELSQGITTNILYLHAGIRTRPERKHGSYTRPRRQTANGV